MNSLFLVISCFVFDLCTSAAKEILMTLEPRYNDKEVFQNFTLRPKISNIRVKDCALHCLSEVNCSLLGFNDNDDTCSMFGNLTYQTSAQNQHFAHNKAGMKYYLKSMIKEMCPTDAGYMYLGDVNACIKVYNVFGIEYTPAATQCQVEGGRLIILEDEDKANAVLDILDDLGLNEEAMLIGLNRIDDPPNTFVWVDATLGLRYWWADGEPNNNYDELCVFVRNRTLFDAPCDWSTIAGFICEILR